MGPDVHEVPKRFTEPPRFDIDIDKYRWRIKVRAWVRIVPGLAKGEDVSAKALSTMLGELLHIATDKANANKIYRAISNDLLNLNPQDDDHLKVIESIINLVAADSDTGGAGRLVKIMRDLYSCRRNQGEDLATFAKRFEALATLYLNNNHGKNE